MKYCRLLALLFLLSASSVVSGEGFRIAAASSLQFVLQDVLAEYSKSNNGPLPEIVYGSSGNLYRQIQQGAPFELYFSARSELVENLFAEQLTMDSGDQFGSGRLVFISGGEIAEGRDLTELIEDEIVRNNSKIAIANPVHAPYGRAAEQVLRSLNLWQGVLPNVVYGEQVSQATQFVTSGAAPYGLVSLSLVLSPRLAGKVQQLVVDESLHEPVKLQMVRLNSASDEAQRFYRFMLNNKPVDGIFKRYGLR